MSGRSIVLLAVVLLAAASARAQGPAFHTLLGRVTDSSGAALPGTTIELSHPAADSTVRTVVSDRDGRYRIDKVIPGEYVLTFRLPGFGSAIRDLDIGGPDPEFEYDVELTAMAGKQTDPSPVGPSRKVICGMTVITPAPGAVLDPGFTPKPSPPSEANRVKPTIRAVQPTLCWDAPSEPSQPRR